VAHYCPGARMVHFTHKMSTAFTYATGP